MRLRTVLGSGLLCLALVGLLPAAPPVEKLLPETIRDCIQITSVAALEKNWPQTQFGKLAGDPVMKEFIDSLGVSGWLPGPVFARLEMTPVEFCGLAGAGAAGWAFAYPVAGKGSQIVWIDTTGKSNARTAWLETVAARAKKAGGKVTEVQVAGAAVSAVEIFSGRPVYVTTRENLLLLAEHREVLEGILTRWSTGQGSLATVPAYQAVRNRLGTTAADLQFFIDPFGRVEMMRANNPIPPKGPQEKDLLVVLRKQGIDSIKGIGANFRLAAGGHDLQYRVAIHAPPPLRGGLGVLQLIPGKQYAPDPWVPADLAACTILHVDLGAAFDAVGPVFDQFAPGAKEGAFKALLKSLKEDPKGPRVDLRTDFVGRLGSRITLVNPSPDPKDSRPDRLLAVIPTREEAKLQETLRRMFEGDAKCIQFLDKEIWVVESQPRARQPGQPARPPAKTAFCAANNCLYVSSRPDLLELCVRQGVPAKGLRTSGDFRRVWEELDKVQPNGSHVAVRSFTRPEYDYRDLWEGARAKAKPEVESNGWAMMSALVGKTLTGDLGKLPPFAKVAPYLGNAGMSVILHEDGLELVGFTLPR